MTEKFDFESWLTEGLAEAAHALFSELLGTPVERTDNPREDIFAAFKKVCADMDEHNRKVHEKRQEDLFQRALDDFKTAYKPSHSQINQARRCGAGVHPGHPNAGTFVRINGSQNSWTCPRCFIAFLPVEGSHGWIWKKKKEKTDVRHLIMHSGMSVCKNEAFVYGPLVSIKPQEGVTAAMRKWPVCPDCKRVVMEWWS